MQFEQMVPDQRSMIQAQFTGVTFQPNAIDVQDEPLYDTNTFAAGATIANQTSFFQSPAGKTQAQTNVKESGRLPAPQAMAVKGIRFRVVESVLLADFIALMNPQTGYVLDFVVGEKSYNRGPLWYYNNGGGVSGFATATDTNAYTNGRTGQPAAHLLAINIVIDNQASFFAQLFGAATALTLTVADDGGTGLTMQLLLAGFHARGVQ